MKGYKCAAGDASLPAYVDLCSFNASFMTLLGLRFYTSFESRGIRGCKRERMKKNYLTILTYRFVV